MLVSSSFSPKYSRTFLLRASSAKSGLSEQTSLSLSAVRSSFTRPYRATVSAMSVGMFCGMGNLVYFWSTPTTSAAEKPAAAAFHNDKFEMRYVWMCSGLFSSSANGAIASRASVYFGLSTSTSTERSDWTMNGFVGSNVCGEPGACPPGLAAFAVFGGIITVGFWRLEVIFGGEHPILSGVSANQQG